MIDAKLEATQHVVALETTQSRMQLQAVQPQMVLSISEADTSAKVDSNTAQHVVELESSQVDMQLQAAQQEMQLSISNTGEVNVVANVGGGTGEIFRDKVGPTLNFKTLTGSGGILITNNADTVDIDINAQKAFYEGMSTQFLIFDNFLGPPVSTDNVTAIASGQSSGIIDSDGFDKTNHPGVWTMSTGTKADGRVFVASSSTGGFHFGVGGLTRCGTWVHITTLSTAAQEYVARAGVFNISLPNTINDGIGFEYHFDQNGGRWQGITVAAGESSLDTGITVTADTWYFLEFECNAAGTSVEFFIDGTSVGTLSAAANIPSGNTFDNFYNTHILKLNGRTAREYVIDAFYLYQEIVR